MNKFQFLACAVVLLLSGTLPAAVPVTLVYDPLGPGTGDDLKLSRYLPAGVDPVVENNLPALLLVHGGGWTGGDRANFDKTSRFFADAGGFAVYSIDYRLASQWGEERLEGAQDVVTAFLWVQTQAVVDPARVHALGTSAGAHLLAAAVLCDLGPAVPNINPASTVLFYCPSNLTLLSGTGGYSAVWGPEGATEVRVRMSPALHPRSGLNPFVHYHGDADTLFPSSQAVAFDAALDGRGVWSKLERKTNGFGGVNWSHGFFSANEPGTGFYSPGPPIVPLIDTKSQYRWSLTNLWGQWFGSALFSPPLTTGPAPVTAP